MNIYIIIPFLSIVICLAIADIVYHSNKFSLLNKLFSIFNLLEVFWIFTGEFIYYLLNNPASASNWYKIDFLFFFINPILLQFAMVLTEKKRVLKNRLFYFIYLPAVFFSIVQLTTDFLTGNPEKFLYGNPDFALLQTSLFYQSFILYSLFSNLIVLVLLIHFYLNTKDKARKDQIKYIFIGFSISFIVAMIMTILLSVGIKFHNNISIIITILNISIGYGIWRYDLFKLSPVKAVENIIETMPNFLILADLESTIIDVNPSLKNFFEYSRDEIEGKKLDVLFADKKNVKTIIDNLLSGKKISDFETELLSKSEKIIPVLFSGSVIKNRLGQKIGFVCIAMNITERKHWEQMLIKYNKKLKESNQESSKLCLCCIS